MVKLKCQECGADMVLRDGRYGKFFGCSSYPNCRHTLDYREGMALVEKMRNGDQEEEEISWSEYQEEIFTFIQEGEGNAVVEAVAGSGKTTTIVEALNVTPKDDSVVFCAFNKHIADELKNRAPNHVKVGTLHSLGFAALRDHLTHRPEVDSSKLWNITKELLPDPQDYQLRNPLKKIVSLVKSTLADPEDRSQLSAIVAKYGIETNGEEDRLFELVPQALAIALERTHVIDFDDMIWMPVVMNLNVSSHDWVFVDEAQDLNKCQIELVLRLANGTGRVIAVGDRKQSIYGFRGADVEAIPNLIDALDADILPLSTTYRCPKQVVELAKQLVPQIEAAEWADDGEVSSTSTTKFMREVNDGDLVLCRVNAPLVKICYRLIRQGRKAVIRGRDIGKMINRLIDKMEPRDIHDLLTKIANYKWEQAEKYRRLGQESRIQSLYDKCDTLIALCDGIRDLTELWHKISDIFDDYTKTGVILSSVHRAKGDESERVWILRPDLMPHPLAQQDWQMQQEANIEYVAYTRSKEELVFVNGLV